MHGCASRCILSKFYIKPQQATDSYILPLCCILSKFYIKPQQNLKNDRKMRVVSYRNSTSNHNGGSRYSDWLEVVSYRNSTSNHNSSAFCPQAITLYLIEILHQTTTCLALLLVFRRCILSKFYIKPQQRSDQWLFRPVVSYRNSTSNHNNGLINGFLGQVVSYRNSTSNHNDRRNRRRSRVVVSYRNSTSNHNGSDFFNQHANVVSYRNSTSNHNNSLARDRDA